MNQEYLTTFLEVAKTKNLSKAAMRLHISQPTVTAHIQKLEKEFGCRLIERDTRNCSLTPQGRRFFLFAEYMDQEHKHLKTDLAQINQGITGSLSVVASPNIGEFILPRLISKFREDNPSIEVVVNLLHGQDVVKRVTDNPDLVGFTSVKPITSDLKYIKFGNDEIVLIVYPGHPFSFKKEVTISDLIGESLIFREEPVGRSAILLTILKKAGIDLNLYQPRCFIGSNSGVLAAVEAKAGIGFIPKLAIQNSEALGLIKVVKIHDLQPRYDHYFMHNKTISSNALLNSFIRFVHENVLGNEASLTNSR
jgi:DNA-binding transcriptional LysR family regulator